MLSNGAVGKRLLNVEEAGRRSGPEGGHDPQEGPVAGASLRQGGTGSTAREMWRLMEAGNGEQIGQGFLMSLYCSLD